MLWQLLFLLILLGEPTVESSPICPATKGMILLDYLLPFVRAIDLEITDSYSTEFGHVGGTPLERIDALLIDLKKQQVMISNSFDAISLGMISRTPTYNTIVTTNTVSGAITVWYLGSSGDLFADPPVTTTVVLSNPLSASLDPLNTNDLIIADTGNNVLRRADATTGVVTATYGSPGSGTGQLLSPAKVLVDPLSGDMYVADLGNARIQVFTKAGVFKKVLHSWKGTAANLTNIRFSSQPTDQLLHASLGGVNQIATFNYSSGALVSTFQLPDVPLAANYVTSNNAFAVLHDNPLRIVFYAATDCTFEYSGSIYTIRYIGPDASIAIQEKGSDRNLTVQFVSVAQVDGSGSVIPATRKTDFTSKDYLISVREPPTASFSDYIDGASLTYKAPSSSAVYTIDQSIYYINSFISFNKQNFITQGYSIKTTVGVANYTFLDPSNELEIVWRLDSTLSFDPVYTTSVNSTLSTTTFTLYFANGGNDPGGLDSGGASIQCLNNALVDGILKPVKIAFDITTLQLSIVLPHFTGNVSYDPQFGFFGSPSSSDGDGSGDGSSSYDTVDGGVLVGAIQGGVWGFLVLIGCFIVCIISLIFLSAWVSKFVKKQKAKHQLKLEEERLQAIRDKTKHQVETLWCMANGRRWHQKNGGLHWLRKHSTTMGEGGDSAKFLFEYLPPETVDHISCFVVGADVHHINWDDPPHAHEDVEMQDIHKDRPHQQSSDSDSTETESSSDESF